MTVICKDCGAKMPTDKILELHMNKRHGGEQKVGEKTVINPEVKTEVKPEAQPVHDTAQGAVEVVPGVPEGTPAGMVEIISADGRNLEVSIGSESWNGKTIFVKKEVVEDVKRILEAGGYFIKN